MVVSAPERCKICTCKWSKPLTRKNVRLLFLSSYWLLEFSTWQYFRVRITSLHDCTGSVDRGPGLACCILKTKRARTGRAGPGRAAYLRSARCYPKFQTSSLFENDSTLIKLRSSFISCNYCRLHSGRLRLRYSVSVLQAPRLYRCLYITQHGGLALDH